MINCENCTDLFYVKNNLTPFTTSIIFISIYFDISRLQIKKSLFSSNNLNNSSPFVNEN